MTPGESARDAELHGSAVNGKPVSKMGAKLRDSMRASAAPFLQPGEPVQEVFGAETSSRLVSGLLGGLFGALGGIVAVFLRRYRIFAVTDRRILVLDSGKWNMTKALGVVMELPRTTQLGPPSGIWHVIRAGSERLRVHRRFFSDIRAADAAIGPDTGQGTGL